MPPNAKIPGFPCKKPSMRKFELAAAPPPRSRARLRLAKCSAYQSLHYQPPSRLQFEISLLSSEVRIDCSPNASTQFVRTGSLSRSQSATCKLNSDVPSCRRNRFRAHTNLRERIRGAVTQHDTCRARHSEGRTCGDRFARLLERTTLTDQSDFHRRRTTYAAG